MNCAEVRRKLLEDPNCSNQDLLEHAANCAACAGERERAIAFERQLQTTLEVQPPADLEARLKAAAVEPDGSRRYRLATAATLVLVLSSLLWVGAMSWFAPGPQRLAGLVLDHIQEEAELLDTGTELPVGKYSAVLAQFGVALGDDLGPVYHAERCPLDGHEILHLVVAGRRGPVTLLLLPGTRLEGPQPVASDRFTGVLVPASFGSMAVVGGPGEMVDPLVQRWRHGLTWKS